MRKVLHSLGLPHTNHVKRKEDLARGICLLTEYHFSDTNDKFKAKVMGKMLFHHKIYNKESPNHVAVEVSRSVTSSVSLAVDVLCNIDKTAGSINFHATQQLAKIEGNCKFTPARPGHWKQIHASPTTPAYSGERDLQPLGAETVQHQM